MACGRVGGATGGRLGCGCGRPTSSGFGAGRSEEAAGLFAGLGVCAATGRLGVAGRLTGLLAFVSTFALAGLAGTGFLDGELTTTGCVGGAGRVADPAVGLASSIGLLGEAGLAGLVCELLAELGAGASAAFGFAGAAFLTERMASVGGDLLGDEALVAPPFLSKPRIRFASSSLIELL